MALPLLIHNINNLFYFIYKLQLLNNSHLQKNKYLNFIKSRH